MKFEPLPQEAEKLVAWQKQHRGECSATGGTIGGKYTVSFTPTSIGMVVKAQCNICKEEQDVTDYDAW